MMLVVFIIAPLVFITILLLFIFMLLLYFSYSFATSCISIIIYHCFISCYCVRVLLCSIVTYFLDSALCLVLFCRLLHLIRSGFTVIVHNTFILLLCLNLFHSKSEISKKIYWCT